MQFICDSLTPQKRTSFVCAGNFIGLKYKSIHHFFSSPQSVCRLWREKRKHIWLWTEKTNSENDNLFRARWNLNKTWNENTAYMIKWTNDKSLRIKWRKKIKMNLLLLLFTLWLNSRAKKSFKFTWAFAIDKRKKTQTLNSSKMVTKTTTNYNYVE